MPDSHLSVLEQSASTFASSPAFKIPQVDASGSIEGFASISYEQFNADVESHARYWLSTLRLPYNSVIGLWVSGYTYRDVVHIYGLSRAGYVPQLFSLRLPCPEVIYELLADASAQALVHEPSFAAILKDCPVPTYNAGVVNIEPSEISLPPVARQSEETAFIFHTSGSTSGRPKLVPCSFRWIETVVRKSYQISRPRNPARQDITCSMGSMCHIGQTFMFIGTLQHGSCVIEPTKMPFSSTELKYMIEVGGLNRLQLFAAFMSAQLKAAKTDAKLAGLLAGLDELLYSGQIPREDDDWAMRNGLRMQNLFGSTECGVMLICAAGPRESSFYLREIDGFTYRFEPTNTLPEGTHQSTARLMELVIPKESPDCPHTSLRHADGDFHTGDLFQETSPGVYIFRGRNDDWIKSENSLKIDTKAIEDNAMQMCSDVIAACVVVGSGRPSPAIFVEPISEADNKKLKREIIRKTRQFHMRRYLHERIISPELVFVVPKGSLPRTATKGNIRRKAVEEAYREQLDAAYERLRS